MPLSSASRRFQVLLFATLLSLCVASFGQSDNATISGTITDPSGAVVPGAKVMLSNVDTGIATTAPSNQSGLYVLTNIHPGQYRMEVEKTGFKPIQLVDLTVQVQDALSRNFKLEVGAVGEIVTVNGAGEMLNTTSASVSTVIDDQFVQNMPLNGRSFQSLIALVPGVTFTPSNSSSPGQFSVNGQRTDANYFMVDGVSANIGAGTGSNMGDTIGGTTPGWTIQGGTNGLVSVDAMQEFRIETSSYAPEFGRTPGGQISVVTKSGTNQWHGDAFDYLRNDVFDARDWFNHVPAVKPPLRQNDFGGTLGAPIWKNRTFFFFSYEGLRLLLPQTATGNFLIPAARVLCPSSGALPTLCVSAVWKPLVDSEPIPNGPVNSDGMTAPLTAAYSVPTNLDATSLRVDHDLTRRINLFMRYNHAPSNSAGRYWSEPYNYQANTDTATAGATINFGATKVDDLRANWSRSTGSGNQYSDNFMGAVAPPASAVFGPYNAANTQTIWSDSFDSLGIREGIFVGNVQRQFNVIDSFSMTKGTHQLKFGVDWRRLTPTALFAPNNIGSFGDAYSNMQASTLSQYNASASGPAADLLLNNLSFYAQDTWRTTNKLTLTYGTRWEIDPPPTQTNGLLYHVTGVFDTQPSEMVTTPLYRTKLDSFAPRFGAAYLLTPKTVVRGGFGLFDDLGVSGVVGSTATSAYPLSRSSGPVHGVPFNWNTLPVAPPFPNPLTPPDGSQADNGSGSVGSIDPNLGLPVTYQWNVAVERQLGKSQSLTVSYVGSAGRGLIRNDGIDPVASTSPWAVISVERNADRSDYKALQTEFQQRMSHGLQVLASYTFAKSMDSSSLDLGGAGIAAQTLAQLSNAADLNYGYSDFDVRSTYSGAVSYELPAPRWDKILDAVAQGWAADALIRGRSGYPFTVKSFSNVILLNGVQQYTRPNVVPGQPFWIATPGAAGGRVLNPAAFANVTNGLPGDEVRNSLRDWGAAQTDLAVRRRFKLTERVNLDFRAEYFNLFNHPMFTILGATNWGPSFFGKASSTLGTAFAGNNGSGQNQLYTPGRNRSGQFTLKVIF